MVREHKIRSWQMLHLSIFAFPPSYAKILCRCTCALFLSQQQLGVKLANSPCFHWKCPLLEMRSINHGARLAPTCPLCAISLNFLQPGKKAAGPLTLPSLGATFSQPLLSIFNELSAMIQCNFTSRTQWRYLLLTRNSRAPEKLFPNVVSEFHRFMTHASHCLNFFCVLVCFWSLFCLKAHWHMIKSSKSHNDSKRTAPTELLWKKHGKLAGLSVIDLPKNRTKL